MTVVSGGTRRGYRETPWSSFRLSAVDQEMLENLSAELQCINGYPLVDAMEQRGEVQIGRELQRGEAEAANPQAGERFCIGAARQHVRHDAGVGVDGQNRGVHRVHEVTVEGGLVGRQLGD